VATNPVTLPWAAPGQAEGELHLTLADAVLCLRNSDRLRHDSRRRSPGTKLALLELSLEEVAKANMILLRLRIQGARSPVRLGAETAPADSPVGQLRDLFIAKMHLLTDDALRKAFWNHDIKLEFVEFLMDLSELVVPFTAKARSRTRDYPPRYRLIAALGNVSAVRKLAMASLRESFARLRETGVESLDTAAKRALFVDINQRTGEIRPPEADRDLTENILAVIWTLRTPIVMAEHSEHTRVTHLRKQGGAGPQPNLSGPKSVDSQDEKKQNQISLASQGSLP
jgi:hypothetical protein